MYLNIEHMSLAFGTQPKKGLKCQKVYTLCFDFAYTLYLYTVPSAEQSNEAPPAATHNYEADEVSASITTSEVPAAVLTSEVPSEVPAAVLTNEVPNEVPAAVLTTEVPSKVSSEVPAAVTANDEKLKEDNHGCNQVQGKESRSYINL